MLEPDWYGALWMVALLAVIGAGIWDTTKIHRQDRDWIYIGLVLAIFGIHYLLQILHIPQW